MEPEQFYFEDVEIGSVWPGPTQTITESHFRDFAGMTGDFHPIHLDEEYASESAFGERVAHGMLVASLAVVGATSISRHLEESMVAFLGQSADFREPVLIGDTVTPTLEVAGKEPRDGTGVVTFRSEVRNQDDEVVLEGELRILLEARES